MIAWTVQSKSAFDALRTDGVWYADRFLYNRIKTINEKFILRDFVVRGEVIDAASIYCFGNIAWGGTIDFGLELLAETLGFLRVYLRFDMKHSYLYEIWLDAEDIISAKRMGGSGETQEEIAYSNFMEYIRDNRDEDSIELLIRKINKDQVIAIR